MRLWVSGFTALGFVCVFSFIGMAQCPPRPLPGSIVKNPLTLSSQNGVLSTSFNMAESVDDAGYTHYCYKYDTGAGIVEAPTLSLNPGDELDINLKNSIISPNGPSGMEMGVDTSQVCGDPGNVTVSSTNVHFHGFNVPPTCHQDDVIHTVIQPNSHGFQYKVQIPANQPPGLYWYHPHIHGFTEFQVNGGAAGAMIVNGIEKYRPEVTGLTQKVLVVRQQYLVPWVPGPYQLTLNYQVTAFPQPYPIIQMKPGEKQFWRVANATIQDFLVLQVLVNGEPRPLQLIALDGYPLPQTRNQTSILVPPAGRAEFIVQAPAAGASAIFVTNPYSTGLTGNPDIYAELANIQLSNQAGEKAPAPASGHTARGDDGVRYSDLLSQAPTTQRKVYFSEEFGGTNGPIQFYITVDGQKQKVFEPNEKPVITTHIGAVEDWTIENRALETHAFHIHQLHFMVLEVDGKPVANHDMRDTVAIPYWTGSGPYHSVKVRMDFRDPTIAGTFVFHCHILLHEDLGMIHKILVEP